MSQKKQFDWEEAPERSAAASSSPAKFDWEEGPQRESAEVKPDDSDEGIIDKVENFFAGKYAPQIPPERRPITPNFGDALSYGSDLTNTAVIEAAKMLGGGGSLQKVLDATGLPSIKDRAMGMDPRPTGRKSAPVQLLESGWSPEAAGVVGTLMQMGLDPMAGFMSMKNPAATDVLRAGETLPELARQTDLGIAGTNSVPGGVPQELMASPLRSLTAKIGDKTRKKLFKNAFSRVDQAYGDFKPFQNDLAATPFSDQALKDRFLKPGMSPGEMKRAFRQKMDKNSGLGKVYNDIWDRNSDVRILPKDAMSDPGYQAWRKEMMLEDSGREVVEAVEEQIRRQHDFQTLQAASPEQLEAMQKANKILEDAHVAKKQAEWVPDGNSLEHQELTREQALMDFKPVEMPPVVEKADPGMNPNVATIVQKKAMDVARGKKGATGDIMNRWARNSDFKEGMRQYSNAVRRARDSAVSAVDEAAGPALKEANRAYNVYGYAEKPFNRMMTNEANRMKITQVDGILAALHKLPALVAKKTIKYAHTPSGAIRLGNWAEAAGASGLWDRVLNEMARRYKENNENESPQ